MGIYGEARKWKEEELAGCNHQLEILSETAFSLKALHAFVEVIIIINTDAVECDKTIRYY